VVFAVAVLAALVIEPRTSKHSVRAVYAQSGCSEATLTGNYGFEFNGFTTAGRGQQSPPTRPLAAVGVITFDGAGNLSFTYTLLRYQKEGFRSATTLFISVPRCSVADTNR